MKYNTCLSLCLLALATLSTSAVPTATVISEQIYPQISSSSLHQASDVTPPVPLSLDETPSKHNLTQHKGGGGHGGGGHGGGHGGGGKGGSSGKGGGTTSSNGAGAQGGAVGGAAGGKGGQFSGSTRVNGSPDVHLLCVMLLSGVVLSPFMGV
ncbi:hypothetical protein BKA64DRAFT_711650 [Cadophora sp. MPI-SDFR-AT-0126]|nr:hypothetical protein BKA64DRAFT_711650 [Leotiomycetes sp. MPI-SDFR-AT-0126]